MNNIVNKFLFAGDRLIPELHLPQSGPSYSACQSFIKHLQRIQKFRETGNIKQIYQHELHKAGFLHDAAYSVNKDLAKLTISDKVLKDKAYKIAINPKYERYQKGLKSMVDTFFERKNRIGSKDK